MKKIILLCIWAAFLSAGPGNDLPDLRNKEHLALLGTGKILEDDNSVILRIRLLAVEDYWIVYEKENSSHDLLTEKIKYIDFRETPWGPLRIDFTAKVPLV